MTEARSKRRSLLPVVFVLNCLKKNLVHKQAHHKFHKTVAVKRTLFSENETSISLILD